MKFIPWLLFCRLIYTPCDNCAGFECVPVILQENQTGTEIPALNTTVFLCINITELADAPTIFLTRYGDTILPDDPTETIIVRIFMIIESMFK